MAMQINDTEPPVRLAVRRCLELFCLALQACEGHSEQSGETGEATPHSLHKSLVAERDKFYIWVANTSALEQGQASMEYRLGLLPGELEVIRERIGKVSSELQKCIAASEHFVCDTSSETSTTRSVPSTNPSEKSKTDSEEEPDLAPKLPSYAASVRSIDTEIQSLDILSDSILNAAAINRRMSTKLYTLPDVDRAGLSSFFNYVLKRDFPRLSKGLRERMLGSMVERYQRIYHRTHPCAPVLLQSLRVALERRRKRAESKDANFSLFRKDKRPQEVTKSRPSLMKRTGLHRNAAAKSAISAHDIEVLEPRPPKSCHKGSEFDCELCRLRLSSETGIQQSLWSEHINRDLEVYVCLVDKCDQPNTLYSSRAEWIDHMNSHFPIWRCLFERGSRTRFDSVAHLMKHYEAEHDGMLSDDMLPSFAPACEESRGFTFTECPFCDEPSTKNIEEHIYHHLRYLALMSIPPTQGHDSRTPKEAKAGGHESVVSGSLSAARSSKAKQEFDQVSFKHGTQYTESMVRNLEEYDQASLRHASPEVEYPNRMEEYDRASLQHASPDAESPNSAQESGRALNNHKNLFKRAESPNIAQEFGQAPSQHGSQDAGSGTTAVNVRQDGKSEETEQDISAGRPQVNLSQDSGRLAHWGFMDKISKQHEEWQRLKFEQDQELGANCCKLRRLVRRFVLAFKIP